MITIFPTTIQGEQFLNLDPKATRHGPLHIPFNISSYINIPFIYPVYKGSKNKFPVPEKSQSITYETILNASLSLKGYSTVFIYFFILNYVISLTKTS